MNYSISATGHFIRYVVNCWLMQISNRLIVWQQLSQGNHQNVKER